MVGTRLCQIFINIEWSSIMTNDRIPFCCQNNIRRADASDASDLIHALVIFKQCHKSGNTTIHCTVHHLIYDICVR